MRVPNNLTDEFSNTLNKIYSNANKLYLDALSKHLQGQKANVMLGDASVTQQDTFDPKRVAAFLEQLSEHLEHWSSQGVAKTDTDDLRRLHIELVTQVDKYEISCYVAIQYHALPFYRCDNEVLEIKKQLIELDERIAQLKPVIESKKNLLLEGELRKRGMNDLDVHDLLVNMYNDEELFSDLAKRVHEIEENNPGYYQAMERKEKLLSKLNGMIIEVYSTKPLPIDQNQLIQGEEGAAIHLDLLAVNKNGGRSGIISLPKITEETKKIIIDRFREIEEVLVAIG